MPRAVRSVDIGPLQDAFLISAVTMIIVIRLQLWLTNYPQLGGGRLHIAHLLWGGLFMLVTIILLLSFLGRRWRKPAAILGGIGFGFFIDELGKFITEDNDYFFQPTAALVYVIFVILYLVTRYMQNRRGFSGREYLFNAFDLFSEAAARDLDARDKARALALIDKAGDEPLAGPLRELVRATDAVPVKPPNRLERAGERMRRRYFSAVEHRGFRRLLLWGLGLWAGIQLLTVFVLVLSLGLDLGGAAEGFASDSVGDLSFVNIGSLVSATVSAVLIGDGILTWRRGDRAAGLRRFDRALLVQIFVTQVFIYAESSFSAISGMLVSILLLVTIRYMEGREREREGLPEAVAAPSAVLSA
jgi:hypothetical protein